MDSSTETTLNQVSDEQLSETLNELVDRGQDASAEVSGEESASAEGLGEQQAEENDVARRVEALEQQNRDLQEKVLRKDQTMSRQGQELGQLRKFKDSVRARIAEIAGQDPTQELVHDPGRFRNDIVEQVRLEGQLEQAEHQEQALINQEHFSQNEQIVRQAAPDIEQHAKAMAEYVLRASGGDQNAAAHFINHTWAYPPMTVLSVLNAVKAEQRAAELQAKYEEQEGKAGQVVDKINSATRAPVSNRSGGSTKSASGRNVDYSDEDIHKLSDADLDRLYASYFGSA